jgi:hypothetical protein
MGGQTYCSRVEEASSNAGGVPAEDPLVPTGSAPNAGDGAGRLTAVAHRYPIAHAVCWLVFSRPLPGLQAGRTPQRGPVPCSLILGCRGPSREQPREHRASGPVHRGRLRRSDPLTRDGSAGHGKAITSDSAMARRSCAIGAF